MRNLLVALIVTAWTAGAQAPPEPHAPRPRVQRTEARLTDAASVGRAGPIGGGGGAGITPAASGAKTDGGTATSFTGSGLIAQESLAPPARAGTARFKVEGCAAHPERGVDQTTRAMSGEPSPTGLNVLPLPRGVLVIHELAHACCLKAKIKAHVNGKIATVREILSGHPYRCMCSSALRTAVALAPGTYQLVVELEQDKKVETVREQALSVP